MITQRRERSDTMYKAFIFDVDGTLIDTEKAAISALQAVLSEKGKEYTKEELAFAFGLPSVESLKKFGIENPEEVQVEWAERMISDYSKDMQLFDGIEKVLHKLAKRTVRLGIVTSKTREEYIEQFQEYNIHMLFEQAITADDTEKHKPDPEPLKACLTRMHTEARDAVYIGDTLYDMHCAQSAGVKFALASWGTRSREEFVDADYILEKPKDILTL